MIKAVKFSSLPLIAATVLVTAPAAQAQPVEVGVNAAVRNEVTMQSPGDSLRREAVTSGPVYSGDNVQSGDGAALQILFQDETVFTVGANSDLDIDEYIYNPDTASGSLVTTVKKGAFRFMSGSIAADEPDNVRIRTRVGVIGVRGTMLDLVVGEEALEIARAGGMVPEGAADSDGATLVVLRGPGRNQSGLNRDGGVYLNSGGDELTLWKSGTAAFIPREGAQITGPFRVTDTMFLALTDALISSSANAGEALPGVPQRDLGRVTRRNPDLREIRRPQRPGGPGGSACPGECPNGQDSGDTQTGQLF